MTHEDEGRSVGELLAAVAGNVAAVPMVLGFVALGSAVVVGRAVTDLVTHALALRSQKRPASPRTDASDHRR